MPRRARAIALLLFGSGLSALLCQVVWLRELRLIFGASTPASAAVLAVFMGGLGFGSLVLGKRVDRTENALRFYGSLEVAIAIFSAISPSLLWLVSKICVLTGGSPSIGIEAATGVRVLLTAIVFGPPTFLIGGTLPAASRAAMTDEDRGRRSVALLYGANTLGGVLGARVATFLLLEAIGVRETLWVACALNGAVGLLALHLARSVPSERARPVADEGVGDARGARIGPPARFILAAAGIWYNRGIRSVHRVGAGTPFDRIGRRSFTPPRGFSGGARRRRAESLLLIRRDEERDAMLDRPPRVQHGGDPAPRPRMRSA